MGECALLSYALYKVTAKREKRHCELQKEITKVSVDNHEKASIKKWVCVILPKMR